MNDARGILFVGAALSTLVACAGPRASAEGVPRTLTDAEIADLTYVREEEKLARDVYLALGERFPLPQFENIAEAETRHMAAAGSLLERYGIPDPVGSRPPGSFQNQELEALYRELVEEGLRGETDALRAGARLEEIDLADIGARRERASRQDVRHVFDQLARGSRNHLRAFVTGLRARDVTYEPTVLDRAAYDAIVTTPHERGGGHGRRGRGGGCRPGAAHGAGSCRGHGSP